MTEIKKESEFDKKVDEMSIKLSLPKESIKKLAVYEYYDNHFKRMEGI